MKLVIDLQGTQTESRYRGIGRQARSIATAIIAQAHAHDVYLLFNSNLATDLDQLEHDFLKVIPRSHLKFFKVPQTVQERDIGNLWRMRAAELTREAYLADMRPDVVYLSSLFEGVNDDAVTSVGLMEAPHATAVTLFDLIPLYDRDLYLGADFVQRFYFRRAQSLKRADLLLAISESARREAMEKLYIPKERIDVALLAADPNFRKYDLSMTDEAVLLSKYKLPKSFILYVGAIEARKNVSLMIEAFRKLPEKLQSEYALVFGGRLHEPERLLLRAAACRFGVDTTRILFPGYIDENDLAPLYGLCSLFIFPSIQEGFGLPPLEAMACGAPVLAARNSSLPEVMGRDDLMFGTYDPNELAAKMQRILTDPPYAQSIRKWGVDQAAKFSWTKTGGQALQSLENLHERHRQTSRTTMQFRRKQRLAFFSPLPNDKSGVADYSAELLKELGRFYDIECVVAGTQVTDPWVLANFAIRDVEFFKKHANSYDRIVYSIGNSALHVHMFDLMQGFPGVVILHDFFLSGVFDWMGNTHLRPPEDFIRQLYATHGLPAIDYVQREGREAAAKNYAANHIVFENALGVLVHSQWAISSAQSIYGNAITEKMICLPQLRGILSQRDRKAARLRLGIDHDAFVVCSLGFVSDTKLSDRLFEAWIGSKAGQTPDSVLIYVGENIGGAWGQTLQQSMDRNAGKVNAEISGYVDSKIYDDYLVAADVAVQLRTNSRGETSRAILDCMAAGLPVIVNAHGTAAELPEEAVLKLPDAFTTVQLAAAIDALHQDKAARTELGMRGQNHILDHHHPAIVGDRVRKAVEEFYVSSDGSRQLGLLGGLGEFYAPTYPTEHDFSQLAQTVAQNASRVGFRRILYDITLLAESDAHTGIERLVRSMLIQLMREPPPGYRVEPVRIEGDRLRFAREYVSRKFSIPANVFADTPVDFDAGDIYVMLEWSADRLPHVANWLQDFRRQGGRVVIGVNDLLPLQIPHRFPPHLGAIAQRWFETTLNVADHLACISRCVADDVLRFGNALSNGKNSSIQVDYYHCAYDIKSSLPTTGLPENATKVIADFKRRKTFLMVGTIEPRKGHFLTIQAFQQLWTKGIDANLVIVGKKGWLVEDVERIIAKSPERDKRLFWFKGISDEFLELLYGNSTALIAASEAEGFGLPLIEAASHKLPLIARDIPVFREVAGPHAFYFESSTPAGLADELTKWLSLARKGGTPDSSKLKILSWKDSAKQFFDGIGSETHYGTIRSGA